MDIASGGTITPNTNCKPAPLGGQVADLKSDLGENSIDKTIQTNFTENKTLISTTGAIEDYNGRSVSDEIETNGAATLRISNANSDMRSVVFYNANREWCAGINESLLGDGDYDIPADAVYMRYCALSSGIASIVIKLINIPTVISKVYDSINLRARIYNWQSKRYVSDEIPIQKIYGATKYPNNLVVVEDCVDGEYVVYNTGKFKPGTGYFRTGYLPVTAGNTYKSNVGRNIAWYTRAKVYISGASGTGIQSGLIAPENAAYLAISVNVSSDGISNPADLYCADANNYGTTKTIIKNLAAWCSGKKINWIGDSIVDGNDFDEEVCSALDLTKLTTDGTGGDGGINGSTIALKYDGTDGRNALCVRYANMPNNADIIAVSCGTNDWMYAWCPIGTIDDADDGTSNTTFYGALKTLCKGLIDKYPQKVIFFTTPIKRAQAFEGGNGGEYTQDGVMTTPFSRNKYGKTLGDYADIITEVCGYYSIPVLDMYRESLLNPSITTQQNMFDNVYTHPNTTGQRIMARRVCGWLTQLGYEINGLS